MPKQKPWPDDAQVAKNPPLKKITLKEAQAEARQLGYVLKHDVEWGEYTVNVKDGKETTKSYHSDLDDAYHTMKFRAERKE